MKFDITVRVEVDEFPHKEDKGREKAKEFLELLIDPQRIPYNKIEDYEVLNSPKIVKTERNQDVEVGGRRNE